jgi:hypothetical protein
MTCGRHRAPGGSAPGNGDGGPAMPATATIGLLRGHGRDEIPASHGDLAECPPVAALTTLMPGGARLAGSRPYLAAPPPRMQSISVPVTTGPGTSGQHPS